MICVMYSLSVPFKKAMFPHHFLRKVLILKYLFSFSLYGAGLQPLRLISFARKPLSPLSSHSTGAHIRRSASARMLSSSVSTWLCHIRPYKYSVSPRRLPQVNAVKSSPPYAASM